MSIKNRKSANRGLSQRSWRESAFLLLTLGIRLLCTKTLPNTMRSPCVPCTFGVGSPMCAMRCLVRYTIRSLCFWCRFSHACYALSRALHHTFLVLVSVLPCVVCVVSCVTPYVPRAFGVGSPMWYALSRALHHAFLVLLVSVLPCVLCVSVLPCVLCVVSCVTPCVTSAFGVGSLMRVMRCLVRYTMRSSCFWCRFSHACYALSRALHHASLVLLVSALSCVLCVVSCVTPCVPRAFGVGSPMRATCCLVRYTMRFSCFWCRFSHACNAVSGALHHAFLVLLCRFSHACNAVSGALHHAFLVLLVSVLPCVQCSVWCVTPCVPRAFGVGSPMRAICCLVRYTMRFSCFWCRFSHACYALSRALHHAFLVLLVSVLPCVQCSVWCVTPCVSRAFGVGSPMCALRCLVLLLSYCASQVHSPCFPSRFPPVLSGVPLCI